MGTPPTMDELATLAETGRSPAGPLPGFVILGAMKCGTTTLYDYLRRHDGVFLSTPKEPCFFADDRWYGHGEAFYRSLFAGARPDQLCGEASTPYTRREHGLAVPGRMPAMIPDAKLIYVVRHPVDRPGAGQLGAWRAGSRAERSVPERSRALPDWQSSPT